jgi:uncharacterized protein (DUF488 family)
VGAQSFRDVRPPILLTIGHSTHEPAAFLDLLRGAGVEGIADVRRFPGSRRHPQFSREALGASLAGAGIAYEHLPELGGRRSASREPAAVANTGWRVPAFRAYADHLRSPEFAAGRARLRELALARPTALMCAEAAWWRCHRRLIADVFVLDGWDVEHVMPDGRLIAHELPGFLVPGADGLPTYP